VTAHEQYADAGLRKALYGWRLLSAAQDLIATGLPQAPATWA
jgi:hypothetical protein